MAELLLELLSEEIPARMQQKAAGDLKNLLSGKLADQGLKPETAHAYVTPRRLCLHLTGLADAQEARREERKGPRTDAPEKAIQGFLKSAGVTLKDCQTRQDKKGAFYVAMINKKNRQTTEVLAEIIPEIIRTFPWPKSMRWGAGGALRWVRPLRGIVCVFDGKPVGFEIAGLTSGNSTRGHRFLAPDSFAVKNFSDYREKLDKAFVLLDQNARREKIAKDAAAMAEKHKVTLIDDLALLNELTGLSEYPHALIGEFDKSFLDVPEEVLISEMRGHQKYFSLRDKTGALANKFIVIANIKAGKDVLAGNQRVLAARLADARFFWNQDRKVSLQSRVEGLKKVTFHRKLGSQYDRVKRLMALAKTLSPMIGADAAKAEMAAGLAKADLVTGMVGEFPELQGVIGGYYALNDGLDKDIAAAISTHYTPAGPSDAVPQAPIAIVVALADRLDMLVNFWAIGEKPTGSKDPFALRRAALGVIRLIVENNLRLNLSGIFAGVLPDKDKCQDLMAFIIDRLQVQFKDQGVRHDMIRAVLAPGRSDDLVLIINRVQALQDFLHTDDGQNLLIGYRRAANILAIEENKDGVSYEGAVEPPFFELDQEKTLYAELEKALAAAGKALEQENFTTAMIAMAALRAPLDAFFDKVTVNSDNKFKRRNRLCLLNQIRATLNKVADFSQITA